MAKRVRPSKNQMPLFNRSEGMRLKDAGLSQVAENNSFFLELMRRQAMAVSQRNGCVSCDDLRAFAAEKGLAPNHPNAWGAIFRGDEWKLIGRRKSSLASNHVREIKLWQYAPR